MVFRALTPLALLLAGSCAFSVLSPTRTVRATGALRGATINTGAAGAASAGSSTGAAGVAVTLCGVAAALRRSRVACRAKQYWEGEWICADCGYIYNERAFGMKFEDLQQGFKCPQCAAPRRRFARKLGDKIGTTLDGGDTPIIIFTAVCLLVVLGIAYYSLQ
mmetsp:Transcript_45199/g.55357  ORF Transcript_45199/g.55357 Transcript_45199/m.55357 type:complete len:163 (+) Transcript_45199:56-544(+)